MEKELIINISDGVKLINPTPEYFKDLVAMLDEMPIFKHSAQAYTHSYTPLKDIISISSKILKKHNFGIVQDIDDYQSDSKTGMIVTQLIHVSGAIKVSVSNYKVEPMKGQNTHQERGSAITYSKRFAYIAAIGGETGDVETAEFTEDEKNEFTEDEKKNIKANTSVEKEKDWFNLTNKDGSETLLWTSLKRKILDGTSKVKDVKELRKYYKVGNKTADEIENWLEQNPYGSKSN